MGNGEQTHTPESPAFAVGDRVRMLVNAWSDMDNLAPDELCARAGEELIVRRVEFFYLHCIGVSHEHITDRMFGVAPGEIEKVQP